MSIVVQTYTGRMVDLTRMTARDVDPVDIAHALSMICRFNGHVTEFYSVAQHSINVARMVTPHDRLAALLHDAAEAYMGDIVSPIKRAMPDADRLEAGIRVAICNRFALSTTIPDSVKDADVRMLATEARDLLPGGPRWGVDALPYGRTVIPVAQRFARARFLDALDRLGVMREAAQ